MTNPSCPFDYLECTPNYHGFSEMDGCLNCNDCPRYCNGVRETGGMPNAEAFCNWALKLIKSLKRFNKTLDKLNRSLSEIPERIAEFGDRVLESVQAKFHK